MNSPSSEIVKQGISKVTEQDEETPLSVQPSESADSDSDQEQAEEDSHSPACNGDKLTLQNEENPPFYAAV